MPLYAINQFVYVALSRTQAESGRAEKLLVTLELPVPGILCFSGSVGTRGEA